MRKPSFESYVLRYAQELTGSDSASLRKLLDLSYSGHARAFEPVVLLYILRGKSDTLQKLVKDPPFKQSAEHILSMNLDKDSLIPFLSKHDDDCAVERYRRVYGNYQVMLGRTSADREVIMLMRERILHAMKEKKMSNYRVYTDLSLNPGNINRFLKHGDASKLSRKTARRILDYVLKTNTRAQ